MQMQGQSYSEGSRTGSHNHLRRGNWDGRGNAMWVECVSFVACDGNVTWLLHPEGAVNDSGQQEPDSLSVQNRGGAYGG